VLNVVPLNLGQVAGVRIPFHAPDLRTRSGCGQLAF
jgi:hypothetical protein